jgi:predicted regulator of Ras-like GTPase activity (Roadblock/LC7/MglB family)
MNESQTRLLIQRELDGNLSQEEEMRLRRVLMVNDSAVSFRANLSQVVAAVHDLELPDSVRPGDSSRLAVEILDSLPAAKANFWEPLLDIFGNRKKRANDPRSTRSVGSSSSTKLKCAVVAPSTTPLHNTGKGSGFDSSQRNQSISTSGAQTKIDPAVLAPKNQPVKEPEKEKTPYGVPVVDQYVTGTHSAIGGLGKRLNIHKNNAPVEEVGKTLADAIREKVHEHLREEAEHADHSDHLNDLISVHAESDSNDTAVLNEDCQTQIRAQLRAEIRSDFVAESRAEFHPQPVSTQTSPAQDIVPAAVLPVSTNPPHVVPANITTQQFAISVNLGSSMVLTVSPQGEKPISDPHATVEVNTPRTELQSKTIRDTTAPSSQVKGHDFSNDELTEWKSGAYPVVPPPAKPHFEGQTETGPLVPYSVNANPNFSKLNLKDTAEIMKQLAADSQKNKTQFPEWSNTWSNVPAVALPETAWVPPPTPANPPAPADPWSPPISTASRPVQNPWAPPAVSTTSPLPAQTPAPLPVPNPVPVQDPLPVPTPVPSPVEYPQPKIVPVSRSSSLPIEAIGDRINQLFNEPEQSKPPTIVAQPAIQSEHAQQSSVMENDVNECLASLGRLAEVRYATNNPGTIKDFGRFLLTDDTMEKIQNVIQKGLSHSNARVITLDAARQMAAALDPILKVQGVVGYMVCGYDGLPITSALPNEIDVESLGGCSLVSYMNSHHIIKVMGHAHIKQLMMQTQSGYMLLADFGKGILVTLSNERDAAVLAKLSETVESITGG